MALRIGGDAILFDLYRARPRARHEPRHISEPDAVLIWRIHLWAWAGRPGRATQRDGMHPARVSPRDAEHTVLHQVIAEHLEPFLCAVAEAGDGVGLPQFVEREFRDFLLCGVFEAGVARCQCGAAGATIFCRFRAKAAASARAAGAGA